MIPGLFFLFVLVGYENIGDFDCRNKEEIYSNGFIHGGDPLTSPFRAPTCFTLLFRLSSMYIQQNWLVGHYSVLLVPPPIRETWKLTCM
jgi:hypothetical protein